MTYAISYVPSAEKAMLKLDRVTVRRVADAISELASELRPLGCLQMKGGDGELRIRVGDYRVVYDVRDEELVVLVLRLGHRREIYR
ncbi:type II toxin-antitoxin system RelE family toxin [Changpingibacter yushuensis]|uniref:type II toxin-antitoxin system RelE family toxin n=1 Tax=Changpingibacter yushuensis TaxID=2758440 RepID=UPI0015F5F054|nr:type II toxin-antitoxin system RelE/ParE family toxin [Changpingibacter yushuensis]